MARVRLMHRVATVTVCLLIALASSGCIAVKPWERETLARRDMAIDTDPMRATLQNHIRFSKEGSLPVGGGGGGGCGCN